MITNKQLRIFSIFAWNPYKEYSFRGLKEAVKENSNSIIQNAVASFLKEDLIICKKIGTTKLYKVNHENKKVYDYFSLAIQEELPKLVRLSIKRIRDELDKQSYFYSIVIFGSYANRTQQKDSDLDIAIFIQEEKDQKKFERALKSAEIKSLLDLDPHAITKAEFLEMLTNDEQNLGKEIARNHLIIHNPNIFYSMIKEGLKHGFKL
ncbi:MAG: nucleotidyltransferase domain-containing protein [archaeon]